MSNNTIHQRRLPEIYNNPSSSETYQQQETIHHPQFTASIMNTNNTNSHHHSSKYKVWDSCRSEARRLDSEIEQKLSSLESIAHGLSDSATLARFERELKETSNNLDRFTTVVSSLSELSGQMLDEGDPEAQNAARHTSRFEEIVHDKRTELNRLGQEARKRYERGQLLSRVQNEIAAFDEKSDLRTATKEQEAIRRATHGVESILATQARAGEKLSAQRQMFNKIGDKALQLGDQIPFIRDVLKRIDQKRRREYLLLAVLIGFLLFVSFLFW